MLTLRPYQQEAIDAIYAYFEDHKGNPLLVLPTAAGKALVLSAFSEGVLKTWPDQRILVVTHSRELIAQNHAEMVGLWPEAPAGIYSAGLGRREADARILFAGIQSVHRRAVEIGHCDLVLIDEAHLIPVASATMYRRFIDGLTAINPKLKVIGLTATPYRLESGMLHEGEGALFTDIAYEISVRELIDQGYLCPLVSKQPKTKLNLAGVGSRGGEFIASELQAAVDQEAITRAAVSEIITYGEDRKSWLAFCSGVDHARHVAEECGYEFPREVVKIAPTASTLAILSGRRDRWVEVSSVSYKKHTKEGSPSSLRVEYHCGLVIHKEWVCFEHQGYARLKAEGWWQRRSAAPIPRNVDEALNAAGGLLRPSHIFVRSNGQFTEVSKHRFEACITTRKASAPSVTASRATMAGSTQSTGLPIPGGTQVENGSAAVSARTSVTGGKA